MNRQTFVMGSLVAAMFILLLCDMAVVAMAEPQPIPQPIQQQNKVAEACIPAHGERRIVEWVVDADGNQTLVVTAQKFIGTRKGAVQYAILSQEELVP